MHLEIGFIDASDIPSEGPCRRETSGHVKGVLYGASPSVVLVAYRWPAEQVFARHSFESNIGISHLWQMQRLWNGGCPLPMDQMSP